MAPADSGPSTLTVFYLFFITTAMFVFLMIVVGMSFKLMSKTLSADAPEDIKKFHTTYLVGINEVLIIYIYFLVLCYVLKGVVLGVGIFQWVFILMNIAASLIVIIFAADAKKKIEEKYGKDQYKEYLDLMTLILIVAGFLFGSNVLWAMAKVALGAKKGKSPQDS